jgi:hypothetical protein
MKKKKKNKGNCNKINPAHAVSLASARQHPAGVIVVHVAHGEEAPGGEPSWLAHLKAVVCVPRRRARGVWWSGKNDMRVPLPLRNAQCLFVNSFFVLFIYL